jgi:hypothetical protein
MQFGRSLPVCGRNLQPPSSWLLFFPEEETVGSFETLVIITKLFDVTSHRTVIFTCVIFIE